MASFILTENRIFWSHVSDSHADIAEEFLLDSELPPDRYVRIEISPKDNKYNTPISEWIYVEDQDKFPEWYSKGRYEKKVRDELIKWSEKKIIKEGRHKFTEGNYILLNNSSAELRGNSSARLYEKSSACLRGNSSAELYEKSSAYLYENSSAMLYEESSAELYENSSACLCGNSSADLYDNSSARLYGESSARLYEKSSAYLYEKSNAKTHNLSVAINTETGQIIVNAKSKYTLKKLRTQK